MIDEPQSEAIRIKNVYTLSTIRDILTEVGPGLILECCKILQKKKKNEHRNYVICRKIINSAKSTKVKFWLQ